MITIVRVLPKDNYYDNIHTALCSCRTNCFRVSSQMTFLEDFLEIRYKFWRNKVNSYFFSLLYFATRKKKFNQLKKIINDFLCNAAFSSWENPLIHHKLCYKILVYFQHGCSGNSHVGNAPKMLDKLCIYTHNSLYKNKFEWNIYFLVDKTFW